MRLDEMNDEFMIEFETSEVAVIERSCNYNIGDVCEISTTVEILNGVPGGWRNISPRLLPPPYWLVPPIVKVPPVRHFLS